MADVNYAGIGIDTEYGALHAGHIGVVDAEVCGQGDNDAQINLSVVWLQWVKRVVRRYPNSGF